MSLCLQVPEKMVYKPAVNLTAWLVFKYLQSGISKQLERLYPTRPFNADRFLNDEIYRASCDPCALQVQSSALPGSVASSWPSQALPSAAPALWRTVHGQTIAVHTSLLPPAARSFQHLNDPRTADVDALLFIAIF